mgnify:CR=1 FL=1
MKYEKGSFIVVPNKHTIATLEAFSQLIYFWLCDFADDDGACWPSRMTLANRAKVSVKTVDRALAQLEERGLIKKENRFYENAPTTNFYQLYIVKGGSVLGTLGSPSQTLGVASHSPTELNPVLTQSIKQGESKIRVEKVENEDKPTKPKNKRKYPHSEVVFRLFPKFQRGWGMNTTELSYAELLYEEYGLEDVKDSIDYHERHKHEPYFPQITKPSELYNKWAQLETYYKKHHG